MRIAGVEPSMGCLKDNCFTIKQYSLLFIHNIYYSFGVRPRGAGRTIINIYIYIYLYKNKLKYFIYIN